MARVHCVDCGTDVAVDPLGQCPEGHLLPASGTRVSTAIGSADPYPDEPVPWVGVVVLDEPTDTVEAERTAQPSAAPGLAPAQRETDAGDLLRELGDLSSDAGPAASSPAPSAPPPAPGEPSAMAMAAAASPTRTTNGHAASNGHAAPNGQAPAGNGHAAAASDLTELSALEQAIQSLETGSARTEAPAPQAAPTPEADDDLGRLFEDLDGLGDTTPAPAAPAPAPTPAPAPAPAASGGPVPPPPSAPPAPSTPPPSQPAAARPAIDTMNFTAKGGPTKGRRRRLLGR